MGNAARARLARVLSPQFFKGNPLIFFRNKKSTLKFCLKFTGKSLYNFFLMKNPCKIYSLFRKVVNFTKEIPLNFFRKKINSEIWPQKYPLGSTSWTPFFQKLSPPRCFSKFLGQPPNLFRTS